MGLQKQLRNLSRGGSLSSGSDDENQAHLANKMDAKFDELSAELHGYAADIIKAIVQVQEKVGSLELKAGPSVSKTYTYRHEFVSETQFAEVPVGQRPSDRAQGRHPTLVSVKDLETSRMTTSRHDELQPLLEAATPEAGLPNFAGRTPPAPLPPWQQNGTSAAFNYDKKMTFQERLKQAQDSWMDRGNASAASIAVTNFLEDKDSSWSATCYYYYSICFNVFAIMIGLLPFADVKVSTVYSEELDIAIDSFLFLEILLRGLFCPSFAAFIVNPSNIIDGLSALPLFTLLIMHFDLLGDGFNDVGWGLLLCTSPIIRCLRLVRRFPKMQILIAAFRNCLEALPVLLYTMAIMACSFTSLLFLVEPRDSVGSLSQAAWFVLSTMTTVGYGDIVPQSALGHALTSVLMVVSPLYMAMPFGIIGYSFTRIWEDRQQILLLQSTRERLAKCGFGAYEIPRLFQLFDVDENAEFDLDEFLLLFREMRIGFSKEDCVELFKAIDRDAGGTIDEKEFVKTLYPNEYRYIYGRKKAADAAGGDPASRPASSVFYY